MNVTTHPPLVHVADDGTRWAVVLLIQNGKEPVVRITGPAAPQPHMDYLASTVMERAMKGGGFHFGWGEVMFRFSPVAVAEIVREVIARTPGTTGRYVVQWQPTNPSIPF